MDQPIGSLSGKEMKLLRQLAKQDLPISAISDRSELKFLLELDLARAYSAENKTPGLLPKNDTVKITTPGKVFLNQRAAQQKQFRKTQLIALLSLLVSVLSLIWSILQPIR